MRLNDPLKPHQLVVLQWIADGCPQESTTGNSYKRTARALADRKLVVISRRSGSWTASVTDAGHYYLGNGTFPDAKAPRRRSPVVTAAAGPPPTPPTVSPQRPPRLSPTEQLVADVLMAGGRLDRPRDRYGDSHKLAELVRMANRHHKAPPGKRLRHEIVRIDSELFGNSVDRITLEDGPQSLAAPLVPVPVPDSVGRYHRAVSELRKQGGPDISAALRARALRLLNALAVEAERRGLAVSEQQPKVGRDDERPVSGWHLLITIGDDTVPLYISEEQDRVEHVPTAREVSEQRRRPWTRIPTHAHVASGRLRIGLGGHDSADRRSFWADRASWRLEDKLPEVLREVVVRAEEAQWRRAARGRAEVEHRAAVGRERERAKLRATEAHREALLAEQLEAWREVCELRRYAEAVMRRSDQAEASGAGDTEAICRARQWAAWIAERADRCDPLKELPNWPDGSELKPHEVERFVRHVPEPPELRYR